MNASAAIADSLLRQAWPRVLSGQAGVLAPRSLDVLVHGRLGPSRLRVPVSPRDAMMSRRTVMNNEG